jgi:hypothetical protein
MLQLSRSLPVTVIAALLAFAAPAYAMPPEVTLTAPSGRQAANPPAFAGTAGTMEWESRDIAVDIWAGEGVGDRPLQVADASLDRETGKFSGTLATALPDGTYTARARQRNSEQETGFSAPLVFIIGAPPADPTPTPTPEATPAPVAAAATPAPTILPGVPTPPGALRLQEPPRLHQARLPPGGHEAARRRHGQRPRAEEHHRPRADPCIPTAKPGH